MQSNKINSYVNKKLKEISRNNQIRKIHDVRRKPKNQITINGKNAISFSCNDYLGLSLNRSVIKASEAATKKFGVGAGASRLVTGNNYLYSLLENKIKINVALAKSHSIGIDTKEDFVAIKKIMEYKI